MRQVVAALAASLSTSLLLLGFTPIAKAQSAESLSGAAALEGVQSRGVEIESGNNADPVGAIVPPTSIPGVERDAVTRTYPVEDLGNDTDLAVESENYIPPTQDSDPAIRQDNLQIQVQTDL